MRKLLLLLLVCAFTRQTTAQSTPAPLFDHLQTLSGNLCSVINDSLVVSLARASSSTRAKGYITVFNVNSNKWAHIGRLPDSAGAFSHFVMGDTTEGLVATFSGKLYFTNDGFQTYTEIPVMPSPTPAISTLVRLLKTHTGYLAQFRINQSNHFCHSTNGLNWTYAGEEGGGLANHVSIVNDSLYYISVGNTVRKNASGGQSFPGRELNVTFPVSISMFRAITDQLWFAGNQNGCFRSTDGGQNWTPLSLPVIASNVTDVIFKDSLTGAFSIGVNGGVYYTTDGGTTFTLMPMLAAQQYRIRFIGNTVYRGGGDIFGYYTTDWGQNYTLFNPFHLNNINDIAFNGQTGIIVGDDGEFAITHNGGYTFVEGSAPLSTYDNYACAVLSDTVFLVGNLRGDVYRSGDAGNSWTRILWGTTNNHVQRIKTDGSNRVLVARNTGGNYYSNDGGLTFTALSGGLNAGKMFDLKPGSADMWFLRESVANGLQVFSAPFPPQSTSTIVAAITLGNFEANDLNLADAQNAYILGEEGTEKLIVYRSQDGGGSWNKMSGAGETIMNFNINGLKFQTFGSQKLAIAQNPYNQDNAAYLKLFTSINGGASWQVFEPQQPLGAAAFFIRSAHFFDTDKFMVGFRNNRLMLNAFADGSGSASSVEAAPEKAARPLLSIYPNPSREQFYLKLPEHKSYRIEIRDMQGALIEVHTLHANTAAINHQLKPGIYLIHAIGTGNSSAGIGRLLVQ